MKLLLMLEYEDMAELQEKLDSNVINDQGSRLLDMVEQCHPGLLWHDEGVLIATLEDAAKIKVTADAEYCVAAFLAALELVATVTGTETTTEPEG